MPLRIDFLLTELNLAGAERVAVSLAAGLRGRGVEPRILGLRRGTTLRPLLETHGLRWACADLRGPLDAGGWFRLARLLEEDPPAVLHTSLFHANLLGRLAGRAAGIPLVVSSIHCCERRRWHLWADRWTQSAVDAEICVSQAILEWTIREAGVSPAKLVVVPNGVELPEPGIRGRLRAELGIPADAPLIGSMGRLHAEKAPWYFLDAVEALAAAHPDLHAVWIGDGPWRGAAEARRRTMGAPGRMHLTGFRTDAPALLPDLDLLVLTSPVEGLPLAVLEAGALGVPAVVASGGGAPEAVRDGETGWLSPPGHVPALVAAIEAALADPGARRRAGEAARTWIRERFGAERMVRAVTTVYQRLLAERGITWPSP